MKRDVICALRKRSIQEKNYAEFLINAGDFHMKIEEEVQKASVELKETKRKLKNGIKANDERLKHKLQDLESGLQKLKEDEEGLKRDSQEVRKDLKRTIPETRSRKDSLSSEQAKGNNYNEPLPIKEDEEELNILDGIRRDWRYPRTQGRGEQSTNQNIPKIEGDWKGQSAQTAVKILFASVKELQLQMESLAIQTEMNTIELTELQQTMETSRELSREYRSIRSNKASWSYNNRMEVIKYQSERLNKTFK